MTHRIAIIIGSSHYDDYSDITTLISNQISDFTEVDDETFHLLSRNLYRLDRNSTNGFRHHLIEQMEEQKVFTSIELIKTEIQKEIAKEARAKAERERKAAEAKRKAEERKLQKATEMVLSKDRLARKRIFAKLKDEFEGNEAGG